MQAVRSSISLNILTDDCIINTVAGSGLGGTPEVQLQLTSFVHGTYGPMEILQYTGICDVNTTVVAATTFNFSDIVIDEGPVGFDVDSFSVRTTYIDVDDTAKIRCEVTFDSNGSGGTIMPYAGPGHRILTIVFTTPIPSLVCISSGGFVDKMNDFGIKCAGCDKKLFYKQCECKKGWYYYRRSELTGEMLDIKKKLSILDKKRRIYLKKVNGKYDRINKLIEKRVFELNDRLVRLTDFNKYMQGRLLQKYGYKFDMDNEKLNHTAISEIKNLNRMKNNLRLMSQTKTMVTEG